jgi:hypothetical protein
MRLINAKRAQHALLRTAKMSFSDDRTLPKQRYAGIGLKVAAA